MKFKVLVILIFVLMFSGTPVKNQTKSDDGFPITVKRESNRISESYDEFSVSVSEIDSLTRELRKDMK